MRIAVPTEQDSIAQSMGSCTAFTLIDAHEDGTFTKELVSLAQTGMIAVVSLLAERKVDTLICGELGLMARSALQMLEIELIPGCTGNIDVAVSRYLRGEPQGDPSILEVEIHMDENDPMQCMHDCASCHGCHVDTKQLQQVTEQLDLDRPAVSK